MPKRPKEKPEPADPAYCSLAAAARTIGVSPDTVRRWLTEGQILHGHKHGGRWWVRHDSIATALTTWATDD